MTKTPSNTANLLTTMALANRYDISIETVRHWVNWANFPLDARQRVGRDMLWDAAKVDAWLRARPVSNKGSRPRWLSVIGHKAANTARSA